MSLRPSTQTPRRERTPTAAGIAYEAEPEAAQIPAFLQQLKDLAARAGGPPPLPEPPDAEHVDALLSARRQSSGSGRSLTTMTDCATDLEDWRAADHSAKSARRAWSNLQRLLRHAERPADRRQRWHPPSRPIRDGRQLLDDPDPVRPFSDELTAALREVIKQRAERLAVAQRRPSRSSKTGNEWTKLDPATVNASHRRRQARCGSPARRVVPRTQLLEALDATPLSVWQDRIGFVPSRRDQARQHAAKQLEPESVRVTPPSATLRTRDDLETLSRRSAAAGQAPPRRREDSDHLRSR